MNQFLFRHVMVAATIALGATVSFAARTNPAPVHFISPEYPAELVAEGAVGDAVIKATVMANSFYPDELIGSGVQESVRVRFVVAPDGTTLNPTVLGDPRKEFVLPALAGVAMMRFVPPVIKGDGVYVETETLIQFMENPPKRRRQ